MPIAETAYRRNTAYWTRWAETRWADAADGNAKSSPRAVATERENLLAAVDRCLTPRNGGELDRAAQILLALDLAVLTDATLRPLVVRRLEQLLAHELGGSLPPVLEARATLALALRRLQMGQSDACGELVERAWLLARELADAALEAAAIRMRAQLRLVRGEAGAALRDAEEARRLAALANDRPMGGLALYTPSQYRYTAR
jgi:hypothetical protein